LDRRLAHAWPGSRAAISRHLRAADGLHAGRLALLRQRGSGRGPDCCLPATEHAPALSWLPSRVRNRRCLAAGRAKPPYRAAAALSSAALCDAPRSRARSVLRRAATLLRRRILGALADSAGVV